MKPVDRSPARMSAFLAALFALGACLAVGLFSWPALWIGGPALVVVLVGLPRGSHVWLTTGAAGLLFASFLGGAHGAPVVAVLIGVTATVVSWDSGRMAISVGEQMGRAANTWRIEVLHVGASVLVGGTTIGAGYVIFLGALGPRSLSAVLLLALAAILLLAALVEHDFALHAVSGQR